MKAKHTPSVKNSPPTAFKALRRAAKKAIQLGRLTGTPAYVLKNGRIVDAAKPTRKSRQGAKGRNPPRNRALA
jgi:hypothetical protein